MLRDESFGDTVLDEAARRAELDEEELLEKRRGRVGEDADSDEAAFKFASPPEFECAPGGKCRAAAALRALSAAEERKAEAAWHR